MKKVGTFRRRRVPERKPIGAFTRPSYSRLSVVMRDESRLNLPKIHLTGKAHGKMRAVIEACPIEVSWLSTCTREGNGDIVIDDVFVPHQVCTSGSTFVAEKGEEKLLKELLKARNYDAIARLDCWGHSHVKGAVFASGVDEQQTNDFLKRARMADKSFFVRLIANKYDDMFASLHLLNEGYDIEHVKLTAVRPETAKWRTWATEQVAEKVREAKMPKVKYIQPVYDPGFYSGAMYDDDDYMGFLEHFPPYKANVTVVHGTVPKTKP